MKKILHSVGIDSYDSFIYEFEPVQLDWWDTKYQTCIEIETHLNEGILTVQVIFVPHTDDLVERTVVFFSVFEEQQLKEDTLIAKALKDQLISNSSYDFSSDHQAFLVKNYAESEDIFERILNLIENKTPAFIVDLKQLEDDDDWVPEKGEALEAYIFNLSCNTDDFSKEDIVDYFEMFEEFEGEVAFKALIEDIQNQVAIDLEENEIDPLIFQRILTTLKKKISKK